MNSVEQVNEVEMREEMGQEERFFLFQGKNEYLYPHVHKSDVVEKGKLMM